jgi:hypothetical protein
MLAAVGGCVLSVKEGSCGFEQVVDVFRPSAAFREMEKRSRCVR